MSSDQPSTRIATIGVTIPAWTFTGIAILMVISRILSRTWLGKEGAFGMDDWLIIFSMTICLIGTSFLDAAVNAGQTISPDDLQTSLPSAFILNVTANTIFVLCIPITKIAVATLLVRIFEPSRLVRILLIGGCVAVFLIAIPEFIMNWASCDPPAALWNPWKYPNAKCFSLGVTVYYGMALGCLSAIQDAILALYPAWQLRKLQMSSRLKIWLSGLLGLGLAASACAIVKVVELHNVVSNAPGPFNQFNVSLNCSLWNIIENCTVIICACVPTVLPLVWCLKDCGARGWECLGTICRQARDAKAASEDGSMLRSYHSSPDSDVEVSRRDRILIKRTVEQTSTMQS